jgi:hypothetical protein
LTRSPGPAALRVAPAGDGRADLRARRRRPATRRSRCFATAHRSHPPRADSWNMTHRVGRGVYRVEVTLPGSPGTPPVPWLMSNPI